VKQSADTIARSENGKLFRAREAATSHYQTKYSLFYYHFMFKIIINKPNKVHK